MKTTPTNKESVREIEGGFDPQKILDGLDKVRDAGGEGHYLTLKGLRDAVNPVKIGELFGMEVWADPLTPNDVSWYITKDRPKFEPTLKAQIVSKETNQIGINNVKGVE